MQLSTVVKIAFDMASGYNLFEKYESQRVLDEELTNHEIWMEPHGPAPDTFCLELNQKIQCNFVSDGYKELFSHKWNEKRFWFCIVSKETIIGPARSVAVYSQMTVQYLLEYMARNPGSI